MEHEDKIRLLLSVQEHSEQYSERELSRLFDEDKDLTEIFVQLALAKQAFARREVSGEVVDVETEWELFHAANKEAVVSFGKLNGTNSKVMLNKNKKTITLYKVAASFIGVLFALSFSFAAIHFLHLRNNETQPISPSEQHVSGQHIGKADTIVLAADSVPTSQPIVFDNISLDKILSDIGAYYKKDVEFANEDARLLRFYFEWNPEEGLDITLHRLNLFESITIVLDDKRLIVE